MMRKPRIFMTNRFTILILLSALAAAGCQGNPQVRRVVDSYNAEARQMEDMIYLLEQDIQVLEQDNQKLRRQLGRGGTSSGSGASSGTGRGRTTSPRGGSGGGNPDLNPPEVEGPPEVETPKPETPRTRPATPRPLNKPALPEELDNGPVLEPPVKKPAKEPGHVKPTRHEQEAAIAPKKPQPEVTDKNVTHIHLNPLQTCGTDFDHSPGDDGLTVLIEPRNGANQYVPLGGTVSVVVLDPKKNGDDARIARWDFSPAEIAEKLQQGATRGIELKLPWPGKPPENARLDVFVRYESPEGKKLQAEKEVIVALPGQFSQRWTPRPADRQRKNREVAEVARTNEPSVAAAPPLTAIGSPVESPAVESPTAEKSPTLITPPAGLSERQPGEKPTKPKWGPTR
jgi:hypothetical protein